MSQELPAAGSRPLSSQALDASSFTAAAMSFARDAGRSEKQGMELRVKLRTLP